MKKVKFVKDWVSPYGTLWKSGEIYECYDETEDLVFCWVSCGHLGDCEFSFPKEVVEVYESSN